ncbi:hypothetical protein HNP38_001172 [Chryseobacterium defluvii]|uniref:Uncharacterized protein n=1 Tax=Chryseobacterium defluvii TaxID=160396 RepID=A0A840KED8_9FLAO|nr:hypothetical protein [Chryseobacterium defluvii]MBB4805900.1 hypothetical protein [Chryseobacterium defluvii]
MRIKVFTISAVFLLIYLYFIYRPIIIDQTEYSFKNQNSFTEKNDSIRLFNEIDFNKNDNFKAILIIKERINISKEIPLGQVFKCSDKELIKKLSTINFRYTGADIATVENEIIIYKNDKVIFRSGIVTDVDKEGLQNSEFGWIITRNGNLTKILNKFNRNFSPIIFL